MRTQNAFKLFLSLIFFVSFLQVDAQVRPPAKNVQKADGKLQVLQGAPGEEFDPSIFYRPLPRRDPSIIAGPDGDHEHEPVLREPQSAFSTRVQLPKPDMVWNNSAFLKNKDIITSEDPEVRTLESRAGYCSAPIVSGSLASVYAKAKAHMPLYIPYRHSKVTVWQGFYYNNGNHHGSIDYGKTGMRTGEDPAFGVYAIAAGKVIDAGWTNGGGNFVLIEHTAPNGFKYRSRYIHLRNGYTHDRNKTKALPSKNADYIMVKKYAQKNGSTLSWGKNYQKVAVKKGQTVKTGQFLGYAGNTGVGGIKFALKSNGDFKNANTKHFNVHLHFSLYIKDTRRGKTGWVKVDPYGAYTKDSGNNCYDLGANTAYNRLFAPFYPTFHNVPTSTFNKYWGYYTGMGMSLQTLALTRASNGKVMVAGSFQRGLSKSWYFRSWMTHSSFQYYFDYYKKKGFRPRQINTTADKGKLRYNVIWERNPSGEAYYCFFNRTDSNFSSLWNTYVKQKKYHVAEHNTVTLNGKRYHAGMFVKSKSNNGFYCYYGMSSSAFTTKFNQLKSKWQPVSVHVNGSTVGAVWRPKKSGWYLYRGMSSSSYQSKSTQLANQGYRLHKVQNYNKNTRFSAIWVK